MFILGLLKLFKNLHCDCLILQTLTTIYCMFMTTPINYSEISQVHKVTHMPTFLQDQGLYWVCAFQIIGHILAHAPAAFCCIWKGGITIYLGIPCYRGPVGGCGWEKRGHGQNVAVLQQSAALAAASQGYRQQHSLEQLKRCSVLHQEQDPGWGSSKHLQPSPRISCMQCIIAELRLWGEVPKKDYL